MLLGEEDFIAEARAWRHRHGGTLFKLWPFAASALVGLRTRLPRMPAYLEHTRAIAAELASIEGVDVVPNPPQVPMFHIHLRTTAATAVAGIRRLAKEERVWAWGGASPTDTPGIRRVELFVGDATLEFTPADVARIVRYLLPSQCCQPEARPEQALAPDQRPAPTEGEDVRAATPAASRSPRRMCSPRPCRPSR
jgi:threonine aldolase